MHLDPTLDDVKKLAASCRRTAKQERVLFHYNGHGVPRPTVNGEIWVFNSRQAAGAAELRDATGVGEMAGWLAWGHAGQVIGGRQEGSGPEASQQPCKQRTPSLPAACKKSFVFVLAFHHLAGQAVRSRPCFHRCRPPPFPPPPRRYTQYIPLSIYELQAWLGTPAIYVLDCSAAGLIINR
jgi:hypothetical protein